MKYIVKQVSSLEKIRTNGIGDVCCIDKQTVLKGETFSYQIALEVDNEDDTLRSDFIVDISSPISEFVKLYFVKNTVMDMAAYKESVVYKVDDDYITKEAGVMPDILVPAEDENNLIILSNEAGAIWVEVKLPENIETGKYEIEIILTLKEPVEKNAKYVKAQIKQSMTLEVIDEKIPVHKTLYTQWFHVDCIADVHNVEIYSEEHWKLIDNYMSLAKELGINMILTPVITPPLDTDIGATRPCVQLVGIVKKGEKYEFDFSLLKRWISICKKNGIENFEISHLFSQGGLKYSPNIMIEENGVKDYMFGWHVSAQSEKYKDFLLQFIPALISFLKDEGIKEQCWFHVSDEPQLEHLASYKYAYDIIKPLIEGCRTFDALSDYEFVKTGLVQTPVTSTDHIEPFLENKLEHQWGYYCCGQNYLVSNKYLSMPSYRNRIIGLQIYKYNLEGFLHWGYNFYYNQSSIKKINPYITSSGDKWLPSGDAFCVYPVKNGAIPSLRALVFREALYDVEICRILEGYIGRDKVVELIDKEAGFNITFSEYPRNNEYILSLIDKMKQMIKSYSNN